MNNLTQQISDRFV